MQQKQCLRLLQNIDQLFEFTSADFYDKLAFTVAYGDLGEACGAKLASLAFLHPHFRDFFPIFLWRNQIFKNDQKWDF